MTTSTLQSSALPTELSKEPRRSRRKIVYLFIQCVRLQEESWNNRQRNRHITNQNTSERNKNFFKLLEILLFLTFSAIYSVFLFFRALKKNMVFFQSNVKFSLTYSHSLCLSIPSIDQLTLNGGPQRKSRDSKCVDTNQKWENSQELPSLPFCFVTVVF